MLDAAADGSLAAQRDRIATEQQALEEQAESTTRVWEAYQKSLSEWKLKLAVLRGSAPASGPDSLDALTARRRELTVDKPLLVDLMESRRVKAREIFAFLKHLADVHEQIVHNVREHIQSDKLTSERYRLGFDVRFGDRGLADRFFAVVAQNTGPFYGQQEGRDKLALLISDADFSNADGAIGFAETLLNIVRQDLKGTSSEPASLSRCLRRGASVQDLYDLVFGFDYLAPVFDLALNDKPLRLLSPGERGILLLVFYLVVDLGDEPLIIDRPEGNLNNQSIVEHLVPVFMAAKSRRQIIIVTHNPNIAIVCDAEQIISCSMDQDASHRIRYETGALENPIFNELSLDLLEGTAAALDARVTTYDAMDARRDVVRLRVINGDPTRLRTSS